MMGEDVAGSRLTRAKIGADQPVVDQLRLEHRRRDVLFHQIGRGAAQRRLRFGIESFELRIVVGKGFEERRAETIGAPNVRVEARDVTRIERRNLASRGGAIRTEQQRSSVEQRRERVGVLAIVGKAAGFQLEFIDQPRVEETAYVGCRREHVARPNIGFADGRTADRRAPFEDGGRVSRFC